MDKDETKARKTYAPERANGVEMALTKKDAEVIVGMADRHDKHHDIAAYFGENQARVAEVLSGDMFGHVQAAPANELPPKGAPGIKGRRLRAFVAKAVDALNANNAEEALKQLQAGIARYDQNEA